MFYTSKNGRNIFTKVKNYPRLADLPAGSAPLPTARYGIRSFDRQWTFEDPRLAKTESPALWASRSPDQIFMTTLTTARLASTGPAATATTAIPDLHHFDGRGGKDIVPLYRDVTGTANVTNGLLDAVTAVHRQADTDAPLVTAERLFAYTYGVLAGTDYTTRFAEGLATPGPRIPLTADPQVFAAMADLGTELLWLHTYAERNTDGRPPRLPRPTGLEWTAPVHNMPISFEQILYNDTTNELRIGDGLMTGVRPDVWAYTIGNLQPLQRWLAQRTAKGSGRSATRPSSPLDRIRPTAWHDQWNDELLDLIRCLTATLDLIEAGTALLVQILDRPTVAGTELPHPQDAERKPPK